MDAFVNAHVLKRPCRRCVANKHYNNDKADKEEPCCPRCQPPAGRICCDLCSPADFVVPPPHPLDVPTRARGRNKTKIPAYERGADEYALVHALRALRESLAAEELGDVYNADIVFLSDRLLDFFVDLAHYRALKSVADLSIESTWVYNKKYGKKIIDLVHQYIPQVDKPKPTSGGAVDENGIVQTSSLGSAAVAASNLQNKRPALGDLTNTSTTNTDEAASAEPRRKRRKVTNRKCGKCGATDHIASNRKCPQYGAPAGRTGDQGGPNAEALPLPPLQADAPSPQPVTESPHMDKALLQADTPPPQPEAQLPQHGMLPLHPGPRLPHLVVHPLRLATPSLQRDAPLPHSVAPALLLNMLSPQLVTPSLQCDAHSLQLGARPPQLGAHPPQRDTPLSQLSAPMQATVASPKEAVAVRITISDLRALSPIPSDRFYS